MQPHSFTVKLFTLLTASQNCVDKMENKNISLEYNYYPGYHLAPSSMLLTWSGDRVVDEGWQVARCGQEEMCLTSTEGFLSVDTSVGKQNRLAAKTMRDGSEGSNWNMRFEVLCDDCEKGEHCNIVNRFMGENKEEETGRMMADNRGRVHFGYNYGKSYEEWFDWTVKILH